MRVIIAGSRQIPPKLSIIAEAVAWSGFDVTEVVCGLARGVDMGGFSWANGNGIPVRCFRPDWQKYGRSAGPIRNHAMAKYAEALVAIWDGRSRGTLDMIEEATEMGLRVFIAKWDGKRLVKEEG